MQAEQLDDFLWGYSVLTQVEVDKAKAQFKRFKIDPACWRGKEYKLSTSYAVDKLGDQGYAVYSGNNLHAVYVHKKDADQAALIQPLRDKYEELDIRLRAANNERSKERKTDSDYFRFKGEEAERKLRNTTAIAWGAVIGVVVLALLGLLARLG